MTNTLSKLALGITAAALTAAPLLGAVTANADATTVNEIAYVTVLRDKGIPVPGDIGEDKAIELGHAICDAFDAGASLGQVGKVLMDADFTVRQAGYIAGASVGAFCPQHGDKATTAA